MKLRNSYVKFVTVPLLMALTGLYFSGELFITIAKAETLDSTNYRIEGATLTGGDIAESTNYQVVSTVGEIATDPYATSSNYILKLGSTETFIADVPTITCFETISDGSSSCTTGPSYLNSNGMVRVCGPNGCYDRARIEFSTLNNPTDTVYGIQISDDNFVTDIRQIDGTTYEPKPVSSRTTADYKTKTAWDAVVTNIRGLQADTQYWVRVSALQGDFTESAYSPILTATTANATVDFDIDIDDSAGVASETAAPYLLTFTGTNQLFAGGAVQTATDLIWLDISTNANDGFAVVQKGLNGGLYSVSESHLIPTVTGDLGAEVAGFGLQNYDYNSGIYSANYDGSGTGSLGTITVSTNYLNSSINNVGPVNTIFNKVYDSDGPTESGRVGLFAKAKADVSTPSSTDYEETITIIIIPRY